MYRIHREIDKIQQDKLQFKFIYTEGEQLVKVRNSLNTRIVELREALLEEPENMNLNLELGFCLAETDRLEEQLEEFNAKYKTKEAQIDMHEQIIEYDLRELYAYIGFLEELELDEKLLNAIKSSVDSITDNTRMLKNLK